MVATASLCAAHGAAGIRLEVLHYFRLRRDGIDATVSEAAEHLAAYLVLAGRPQPREGLASGLWPDRRDSEARANLRRALWQLNQAAPGLVVRSGPYLSISDTASLDLRDLHDLADDVARGVESTADAAAIRLLEGDLLPQWTFDWVVGTRETLRQLRLHALEALAGARLDAQRPGAGLRVALAAVGLDPLRESAHRLVLAAHLAEGNSAAAVLHYAGYRDLLWQQMGLRPGRQMQSLMDDVCASAGADEPAETVRTLRRAPAGLRPPRLKSAR